MEWSFVFIVLIRIGSGPIGHSRFPEFLWTEPLQTPDRFHAYIITRYTGYIIRR